MLADRQQPQQNACMPSITIRDVSAEARAALAARAASRGQSMQEYLRLLLEEAAAKPDLADLMERVERRVAASGLRLSADEILESIHAERG
jgi:antitoxin FitA